MRIQELEQTIRDLMNAKYEEIIGKLPKYVESMDLENYMSANPFKQKQTKDALEKEVVSKLEQFVQKEMGTWIKMELKNGN